jgi:hypothetical protein
VYARVLSGIGGQNHFPSGPDSGWEVQAHGLRDGNGDDIGNVRYEGGKVNPENENVVPAAFA